MEVAIVALLTGMIILTLVLLVQKHIATNRMLKTLEESREWLDAFAARLRSELAQMYAEDRNAEPASGPSAPGAVPSSGTVQETPSA